MRHVPQSKTYGFLALYDEIVYNLILATEPEADGDELLAVINDDYPKDHIRALYPLPVEKYLQAMLLKSQQGKDACQEMQETCRGLKDMFEVSGLMANLLQSARYRTPMTPDNWIPVIGQIHANIAVHLPPPAPPMHGMLEDFTETFNILAHRAERPVAMAIARRERAEFDEEMALYLDMVIKMITPQASGHDKLGS